MSEGEFHKRLAKIDQVSKAKINYGYVFGLMVDEAAKDFPQFTEKDKRDLQTYPNDHEVELHIQSDLNRRREQWFLNWFSSAK